MKDKTKEELVYVFLIIFACGMFSTGFGDSALGVFLVLSFLVLFTWIWWKIYDWTQR